MSSNRELLTQGELAALTEELTKLVDNITEHANAPLDKAHGLNLVEASVSTSGTNRGYFDSGGDRLTSAAPNNLLLRVSAGSDHKIYYVPAILAGPAQTPTLAGVPALLKSLSGIPSLDRALVTEYTQALEDEAKIHNLVLFEHAKAITSSASPKAHGQITAAAMLDGVGQVDARDTLGHRLGRNILRILVGGIVYHVPCDVRKQGPQQGARRLLNGEPEATGQSTAPDGGAHPKLTATFKVAGEGPISFRWRAGPSLSEMSNVFTDAFHGMVITDGYITAGGSDGSRAIGGVGGSWSFGLPRVVGVGAGDVGTASCTVTATPAVPEPNRQYQDDLLLQCEAKAAGDTDPILSIVVKWSAYDVTSSWYD